MVISGASRVQQECDEQKRFACGGRIECEVGVPADPFIQWTGNTSQTIYLHPRCTFGLVDGLMRDTAKAKEIQASKEVSRTTKRIAKLRERLASREPVRY